MSTGLDTKHFSIEKNGTQYAITATPVADGAETYFAVEINSPQQKDLVEMRCCADTGEFKIAAPNHAEAYAHIEHTISHHIIAHDL